MRLLHSKVESCGALLIEQRANDLRTKRRGTGTLVLIVLAPALIYMAGLSVISMIDGTPLARAVCFDPAVHANSGMVRLLATLSTCLGAVAFAIGAPWLLGTLALRGWPAKASTAGVWSVALNSLAVVVICAILRETCGIDRAAWCGAWFGWTCALAVAAQRLTPPDGGPGQLARRYRGMLAIAATLPVVGITLFWREHFIQCFNGDGVECFELARSLREHFLPTWELEATGGFGSVIVNPAFFSSYWVLALQVLLGEGELASRIGFWVLWPAVLLVGLMLVRKDGRGRWTDLILLPLVCLLGSVWYTFYVGYYPYMADLANPGVPDALFTLLWLLSLYALREGDTAGWVTATLLSSLVLYAGPVLFVLTIVAALVWAPLPRRQLLLWAGGGLAVMVAIAGAYLLWGWSQGLLSSWFETIESEYIREYFAPLPKLQSAFLFAAYFVLGCGGIAAAGVLRSLTGTPWERTVASVVLAYLAIILAAGVKNLHYLGPLIPISAVLWGLRPTRRSRIATEAIGLAALVSTGLSLWLCWPPARPVFTLNRQLGEVTTIQTSGYEQACELAEAAVIYDIGLISWEISHHVWAAYSSREEQPTDGRVLLVTTNNQPPAGFAVEAVSPFGVHVFVQDRNWLAWARSRQPLTGPERVPAIFQPIAIRPRPRLTYIVPETPP